MNIGYADPVALKHMTLCTLNTETRWFCFCHMAHDEVLSPFCYALYGKEGGALSTDVQYMWLSITASSKCQVHSALSAGFNTLPVSCFRGNPLV